MSSTPLLSKAGRNGNAAHDLPLRQLADGGAQVVPLTVEHYHRLIDIGILREGESIELLDGMLVRKDRSKTGDDPMTVHPDHAGAIDRLNLLNPKLRRRGCYMRIQQPVTLPRITSRHRTSPSWPARWRPTQAVTRARGTCRA